MKKIKVLNKKRKNEKSLNKPKFLVKLFTILNNEEFSNCIKWSPDGLSFVISDQYYLAQNILPRFFNHKNFSSFNRQLNYYNFRNISLNKNEFEYKHDEFNKYKSLEEILLIEKKPKPENEDEIPRNIENKLLNTNYIKIEQDKEDDLLKNILKLNEKGKFKICKQILNKSELSNNETIIILNFLLDKLEESINNQKNLKKKIENLTNQNNLLVEKLNIYSNTKSEFDTKEINNSYINPKKNNEISFGFFNNCQGNTTYFNPSYENNYITDNTDIINNLKTSRNSRITCSTYQSRNQNDIIYSNINGSGFIK